MIEHAEVGQAATASPVGRGPLRRLCAAVVVSEVGDWLMFIALPLVVLRSSGSALATSAVFLAELVPAVIVGTAGGPIIDRLNPGRLLAWLTAAQALVVLPLMWAGPGRLWLVYLVAAVQAAFTSLTTPAQVAIVPSLSPVGQVTRANALIDTSANVARLVGSPLGGVLLPLIGLHGLVFVDLATFVVGGVLLVPITALTQATPASLTAKPARAFAMVRDGARAIRGDLTLTAALLASFLGAVAQGLFLVLFVLFVLGVLHAGDGLVGLLRGVQAIGGVFGGLLIATRLSQASARTLAATGLTTVAVISAIIWNSANVTLQPWWYVVLFIMVGGPAASVTTGLTTGTQQRTSPHIRGRVLSLLSVAQALGQATGILAAGALSSVVSLSALLDAQAGCYALAAAVNWIAFHPIPWPLASQRGLSIGSEGVSGRGELPGHSVARIVAAPPLGDRAPPPRPLPDTRVVNPASPENAPPVVASEPAARAGPGVPCRSG